MYPECPRWHDGALWFSDQHAGTVCAVDIRGRLSEVMRVPGRPAGLGWRPDGTMLVVSMDHHALLAYGSGELRPVADLSAFHPGPSNDMVVTATGDAYIGNIGFDYYGGESPRTTGLVLVRAGSRRAVEVAEDLMVPNGMVATGDGRHLIVAESFAHRLTRFDIGTDGALSARRVYADLGDHIPDGICLDADGGIWFASVTDHAVLRVVEGGFDHPSGHGRRCPGVRLHARRTRPAAPSLSARPSPMIRPPLIDSPERHHLPVRRLGAGGRRRPSLRPLWQPFSGGPRRSMRREDAVELECPWGHLPAVVLRAGQIPIEDPGEGVAGEVLQPGSRRSRRGARPATPGGARTAMTVHPGPSVGRPRDRTAPRRGPPGGCGRGGRGRGDGRIEASRGRSYPPGWSHSHTDGSINVRTAGPTW